MSLIILAGLPAINKLLLNDLVTTEPAPITVELPILTPSKIITPDPIQTLSPILIPLELNPSTCMGASINFSSDTHSDSSVVGTTETIIWRPDKTNPNPYNH